MDMKGDSKSAIISARRWNVVVWARRLIAACVLAVVPVCVYVVTLKQMDTKGYYWMDRDPDYAYYVAIYNQCNGIRPGFFDHPGVTMIQLASSVIRAWHPMAYGGDFASCGLLNSERYVRAVMLVLLGLTAAGMFLLGICVLKRAASMALAVAGQTATLLVFPTLSESLVKLNAEALLYPLSLGMACMAVLSVGCTAGGMRWLAAGSGVLCGLGILTKLNFIPLVFLPVIVIRGVFRRCVYAGVLLLTMTLMILMTPSSWFSIRSQLERYATRTGVHGSDGVGVLSGNVAHIVWKLLQSEYACYVVVSASAVVVVMSLSYTWLRRRPLRSDVCRTVIAVLVVLVLQTLAVIRTPLAYYLIPAMGLLGALLACVPLLPAKGCGTRAWHRIAVAAYALMLLLYGGNVVAKKFTTDNLRCRHMRAEAEATRAVEAVIPQGSVRVYDISVLSQIGGLNFGNACSKRGTSEVMSRVLTNVYFYSVLDGKFWTWGGPIELRKIALFANDIFFVGYTDPETYARNGWIVPQFPLRLVTNAGNSALYLLLTNVFGAGTTGSHSRAVECPSVDLRKLLEWIEEWNINSHATQYATCTELLAEARQDGARWDALRKDLAVYGDNYGTVSAFMDWSRAYGADDRAAALRRMSECVTAETWPFYVAALASTSRSNAAACIVTPSNLLSRVFDVKTLNSTALMWLSKFYEESMGAEGVIAYWKEASLRAPELRGCGTIYMMQAALSMGDEPRAIAFLKAGLKEVRQEQWTIDRARQMLERFRHSPGNELKAALLKSQK